MVAKAVVLVSGNGIASGIAARVATHLANRRCDTVVYGLNGNITVSHTSVRLANSAGQMPTAQEVQVRLLSTFCTGLRGMRWEHVTKIDINAELSIFASKFSAICSQ